MSKGQGILAVSSALTAIWIAFWLGFVLASSNEQGHPSYRFARDQPLEFEVGALSDSEAASLEYRIPCINSKGRDESDLCAQWRAAMATEDSALWTKWGAWLTAAGVVGLIVTISQGRLALSRAREANEISRKNGEAQTRCYIVGVSAVLVCEGDHWGARCWLKNSGQSPAYDVVWTGLLGISRQGHLGRSVLEDTSRLPLDGKASVETDIAADEQEALGVIWFDFRLTDDEKEWLDARREIYLHLKARVTSRDVFDVIKSQDIEFGTRIFSVPTKGSRFDLSRQSRIFVSGDQPP